MEDGIYFGMSDEDYHAIPRLSSSGIKNLLVSLPYFWAKSWMNPMNARNSDDTPAKVLGRAYHAAVFEPHTLHKRFVGEPDWNQFSDLIETDTAVKARLKELGQTQTKAGELALERAQRLQEMSPESLNIKSIIQAGFIADLDDRQPIARDFWDQINRDIKRIEANPEIHEMVTGGVSEVTILWTCKDTGIPMKARIDKLKPKYFVDMKSFSNSAAKPIAQCIREQIQYYGYYLSMRVYQTAIMAARDLEDIFGPVDAEGEKVLDAVWSDQSRPPTPYLFFQEKDGIPNLLMRRLQLQNLPKGVGEQTIGSMLDPDSPDYDEQAAMDATTNTALCLKADAEIAWAKKQYVQAQEVYGTDEWYPFDMIGSIGDDDFRPFFLEDRPA